MKKSYIHPFVEFIRITADALTGSNPKSDDNNSREINDFKDFSDDYTDWVF
ncbi:MAG: hypothetical protein IJ932_05250 [Ruminococcus sp.]|nr:hypothetical protein [Ruminococcus sp.]